MSLLIICLFEKFGFVPIIKLPIAYKLPIIIIIKLVFITNYFQQAILTEKIYQKP